MTDKTFSKLIAEVDSIIASGSVSGNIPALVRLNKCDKLTMEQQDLVIERNWAAVKSGRGEI